MKNFCSKFAPLVLLVLFSVTAGSAVAQIAYAIDNTNNLIKFQLATPGTFQSTIPVTGLAAGEFLQAIDFRPATSQLYAFSTTSQLYILNTSTGAATPLGPPLAVPVAGTRIGMDFNPVVDRIRITSSNGENLRINPVTGTLAATDTSLTFAAGDPNTGTPAIDGTAYTNNFPGATTTTLYGYDFVHDALVIINPPNAGIANTVGASGIVTSTGAFGFDIVTVGGVNTAYATLSTGGNAGLYTINLATGAATLVGATHNNTNLRGLAIVLPPTPSSAESRKSHGAAGTFDLTLQ